MRLNVPLVVCASLLGAAQSAWLPQFYREKPAPAFPHESWEHHDTLGGGGGGGGGGGDRGQRYPDRPGHGASSNSWGNGNRPHIPPHYRPGEHHTPSASTSSLSLSSSSSSSSYSPSSSSLSSSTSLATVATSESSSVLVGPSSTYTIDGSSSATAHPAYPTSLSSKYPTSLVSGTASGHPSNSANSTYAYASTSTTLVQYSTVSTSGPGSPQETPPTYSSAFLTTGSSSTVDSLSSQPADTSSSLSTSATTVLDTSTTYYTTSTTQGSGSSIASASNPSSSSSSSSSSLSSLPASDSTIVITTTISGTVTTYITTTSQTSSTLATPSSTVSSVPYPVGNTSVVSYPSGATTGPVTVSSSVGPSSGFTSYSANSSTVYLPTAGSGSASSYSIVSSTHIYRNGSCFTSTANSSVTTFSGTGSIPSASPSSVANATSAPFPVSNATTSSHLTTGVSLSTGIFSSSTVSASSSLSLNSTTSSLLTGSGSSIASVTPSISANSTSSILPTGTGSSSVSAIPSSSANLTSAVTTASSTMAPTISPTTDCAGLCSSFTASGFDAHLYSCASVSSGSTIEVPSGQNGICGVSENAPVDLCRVTLGVTTSFASETYIEVWMPNDDEWNGRVMATDNGGLNGCVAYDQLSYIIGKGFAVVGDNGGHNTSAFDGTWMANNNEMILDWVHRARHAAIGTGKQLINSYYGQNANKAYYIGCSTGGQQGLKSAQTYPEDFDGIIAGSAAADYNHLQDWSGRFLLLTGSSGSDTYLSQDQWLTVQNEVLRQCDEPIDGVNDGVIEDPTLCVNVFNSSTLLGLGLTQTQVNTVEQIHTELYDQSGNLLFPSFLYGAEYDGYRTGLLSGTVQGITHDWFLYGVNNGSGFDAYSLNQADYTKADDQDELHDYVSAFNPDLSGFRNAGGKLLQYHGLADPMITGTNAQRYYINVANQMGLSNSDLDAFYRLFRISGMAHCSVGGVSGAGAWEFGQDEAASAASTNVIDLLVDWVENDNAPDTLQGTKFYYDTPSYGVQFKRNHCRFPYRTTYNSGDSTDPDSWGCDYIDDWQQCGPGSTPRLC